jgi:hypothetical protein
MAAMVLLPSLRVKLTFSTRSLIVVRSMNVERSSSEPIGQSPLTSNVSLTSLLNKRWLASLSYEQKYQDLIVQIRTQVLHLIISLENLIKTNK